MAKEVLLVSRFHLSSPSVVVLTGMLYHVPPFVLSVCSACLSVFLTVSILMPSLGCKVHQLKLHKLSAPGIFLISGLMLKFGDVKRAVKSPLPLFLGKSFCLSLSLSLSVCVCVCVRVLVFGGSSSLESTSL